LKSNNEKPTVGFGLTLAKSLLLVISAQAQRWPDLLLAQKLHIKENRSRPAKGTN